MATFPTLEEFEQKIAQRIKDKEEIENKKFMLRYNGFKSDVIDLINKTDNFPIIIHVSDYCESNEQYKFFDKFKQDLNWDSRLVDIELKNGKIIITKITENTIRFN